MALGNDYHWVIPNYYDVHDWPARGSSGKYVLFMGRIVDTKGLHIIGEIAKRMNSVDFVIAGHGDPKPFMVSKNMHYLGPVEAEKRAALYANAICTLTPSRYIEPFCGVAVESMLCGTPAIGSSFGAFTETIEHGLSGFRCRTLIEWIKAIEITSDWGASNWSEVRRYAQQKYDMYKLASSYDKVFKYISDLRGPGWYSENFYDWD